MFDTLRSVPATARTREVVARAKGYEQTIAHWTAVRPSEAQLGAMFDLVTELHEKIVAMVALPLQHRSGKP